MMIMRKHPKFLPANYGRKVRVKIRWRAPRGIDNKKRTQEKHMGAVPQIGWRSPRKSRGIHPSGMREVLVHRVEELTGVAGMAVRIAAAVGRKKRTEIAARAKQMGLAVLNFKLPEETAPQGKQQKQ